MFGVLSYNQLFSKGGPSFLLEKNIGAFTIIIIIIMWFLTVDGGDEPDLVNLILLQIKIEESKGPPTSLAQASTSLSHPETADIIKKRLLAPSPQGPAKQTGTGTLYEWTEMGRLKSRGIAKSIHFLRCWRMAVNLIC